MSNVKCPHCAAIVTDSDALATICPLCGQPLPDTANLQRHAPLASPVSTIGMRDRRGPPWRMLLWGGMAVVIVAIGFRLAFEMTPRATAIRNSPVEHDEPAAELPTVALKPTSPPANQHDTNQHDTNPHDTNPHDTNPAAEAPPAAAMAPANNLAAGAPPIAQPAVANAGPPPHIDFQLPPVVRLADPDGEYVIPALNNQRVTLTGTIKRLRVASIDANSVLDASDLKVREIICAGKIDAASVVKLNAPGGAVEFREKVAGGVNLEVNAPGGIVTFGDAGGGMDAKINGGVMLKITAKRVEFRDRINGGVHVDVALSNDGALAFKELTGGAHIHYHKIRREDLEPHIQSGSVDLTAEFKQTE